MSGGAGVAVRTGLRLLLAAAGVCCAAAAIADAPDPEVDSFIARVAIEHHFERAQLERWFARTRVQDGVLRAISQPATARPWYEFRASQLTPARIKAGLEYWRLHRRALARARAEYGIPEEILVATIGVETFYGRRTGTSGAFDALYTLAFHYPPRAEFFRGELEEFLLLARELHVDPLRMKGSYAGALGIAQFLPGSYRSYAVDFDGDGRRDLWNPSDAIGSIANYYRSHEWQPGGPVAVAIELPVDGPSDELKLLLAGRLEPHTTIAEIRRTGAAPAEPVPADALASVFAVQTESGPGYWLGFNNFRVITRYNRSVNYALAVHELARELVRARRDARSRDQ